MVDYSFSFLFSEQYDAKIYWWKDGIVVETSKYRTYPMHAVLRSKDHLKAGG